MSRNNRQNKSNTVVFPEIYDVEVKLQEVAINYKKLSSREFREIEEERPQEENERTNAERGNGDATGEAAGNDEGQADEATGNDEAQTDEAAANVEVPVAVANKDNKKWVSQQVYSQM